MDANSPLSAKPFPLWHYSSVRLRMVLMVCFALFAQGLMKTDLNMAMVCMVNHTAVDERQHQMIGNSESGNGTTQLCRYQNNESSQTGRNGDLAWSSQEQAWIFAALYWGGLVSVLLCSFLAKKFGPSRVLLIGALLNVVGSFLTPLASEHGGIYFLVATRLFMGCGQGVLLPCAAAVISNWFPLTEKSTAVAIYTMGNQFSTIIGMFISAQLCQVSFLGGWPSIFYIYGTFGGIFCCLWFLIAIDSPGECQSINPAEVEHIKISRGTTSTPSSYVIPWRAIFKSTVVWSTVLCTFSQAFVTVSLTTYLPLYYRTVLKMDLTSNGIMSALPFVAQLVSKIIMAPIADRLKKSNFSVTRITKVSNSIASIACAACLIGVAFLNCSERALAVVLLCIGIGSLSGYIPGYMTSLVSIAPSCTATVNSVANVFGQIASITSPYVIGPITTNGLASEWRWVFIILAAILICTGTFFLVFGSAVEQDWAREKVPIDIVNTDEYPPSEAFSNNVN